MTQTPQLPPNEPPEPLDPAERELARMLRNLPSASPPPELDARILGAARRAVHIAQPRKPRWGRSIGIGTAASALLAVGLFVKMHGMGENLQPETTPEVAKAVYGPSAAAKTQAEAARPEGEPEAAADSAAAPREVAPSPPPPPVIAQTPAMSTPAPAPMAVQAMPAAAPPPQMKASPPKRTIGELVDESSPNAFPTAPAPALAAPANLPAPMVEPLVKKESSPASVTAPAPAPPPTDEIGESKAGAFGAARQDSQNQAAAAATPPAQDEFDKKDVPQSQAPMNFAPAAGGLANPNGASSTTDAPKAKNLDSISVTREKARRADTEGGIQDDRLTRDELPDIDEDAKLAPAQWIDRIRARVKADDGDAARVSLRRFHARYPDAAIPRDLRPLLH